MTSDRCALANLGMPGVVLCPAGFGAWVDGMSFFRNQLRHRIAHGFADEEEGLGIVVISFQEGRILLHCLPY